MNEGLKILAISALLASPAEAQSANHSPACRESKVTVENQVVPLISCPTQADIGAYEAKHPHEGPMLLLTPNGKGKLKLRVVAHV